jgi:hypothetical protein
MTQYEPCDECNAPLAADQRYCIVCGSNRRHPDDPVARYLANVRRPVVAGAAASVAAAPSRRSDHRLVVAALALLPIAAAAGVLVGTRNDEADPNLVAALKAQQAALAKAGPATAAAAAPVAATKALESDFPRSKGFVVQLQTLPFKTTDRAAADQAEAAAKGKGAADVGLINPDDFKLKPASGGDYVLYSGAFKTKTEASKALEKLKKSFPDAKVVSVGPLSVGGGGSLKGTVDEDTVIRAHPTKQQEVEGAQVVQDIQSKVGKDYVEQQQQLPDTIVVP